MTEPHYKLATTQDFELALSRQTNRIAVCLLVVNGLLFALLKLTG